MNRSHTADRLELAALQDFPEVRPGDDVAALVLASAKRNELSFRDGDILVVAQKIVSKAEGRLRRLADVTPTADAEDYARRTGKDPRLVQLILGESKSVLRCVRNLIITEHRLGIVMANAGIDQSNVDADAALLLPEDPDASATRLRAAIRRESGARVAVIIADSIGRAWRNGVVGHAIGVAGAAALLDLRGRPDRHGRTLQVTEVAVADELAAAASLLMGQGAEGKPVVLVRGMQLEGNGGAGDLLRPLELDLFR